MRSIRKVIVRATATMTVLAGAAVPVAASAPASAADDCADVHVIVVRGTGDPGRSGWIVGDGLVGKVRAKVPGVKAAALGLSGEHRPGFRPHRHHEPRRAGHRRGARRRPHRHAQRTVTAARTGAGGTG